MFNFDCSVAGSIGFVIGQEDVGGKRIYCQTGDIGFDDDVWKHTAVTNSGAGTTCAGIIVYVNGVSRALTQADTGAGASEDSTAALVFGVDYSRTVYYGGNLDEVRIWNYVRTSDLINGGIWKRITKEDGLVGYWRLDEGVNSTGVDIFDYAGTSNGTNTTAVWVDSAPINYPGD